VSRAEEEHGFTLIEMVVVCLILGVVLTGITTVFVSGSHAELNLNNRFQAQQAARLALDVLRTDAHGACAANAPTSAKLVLASVPTGTGTDLTMCGAVGSSASYPKVVWCALTSPTVSTQYALYRSTATDSTCTTSNGKLEADNLTSSSVFATGSTIPVEQLQTFTATITVSRQAGTAGVSYKLAEPLTLRNTSHATTASTACSTSDNTICAPGPCPYMDGMGNPTNAPCYPPAIQ
jgi:prepilin-type N-terminal cleavage/methylation domain-containing protein